MNTCPHDKIQGWEQCEKCSYERGAEAMRKAVKKIIAQEECMYREARCLDRADTLSLIWDLIDILPTP